VLEIGTFLEAKERLNNGTSHPPQVTHQYGDHFTETKLSRKMLSFLESRKLVNF